MQTVDRVFGKLNWGIFLIGFLIGMMSVLLIRLGVYSSLRSIIFPPHAIAPTNSFVKVLPKLQVKNYKYSIQKDVQLFSNAYASSESIDANSYIVVDFNTGKILEEKSSNQKFSIASLTKVMTSVIALDLADPSEVFEVSERAARKIPTKIGVVPGQKMTLEELLNAALLTSANDAVEVIKEGVNKKYNGEIFEKAMNEKAKVLGLKNSSFDNPQGFDGPNNYSTAHDLAILSHYAITSYPLIASIAQKDYEFLPKNNNHKQFDLYNWNGLIGVYPNTIGLKIGNTGNAGYTTVVVSERDGKKVLVVLLGAPGVLERDLWASMLLDDGFASLADLPKIEITHALLQEKYDTWEYW